MKPAEPLNLLAVADILRELAGDAADHSAGRAAQAAARENAILTRSAAESSLRSKRAYAMAVALESLAAKTY